MAIIRFEAWTRPQTGTFERKFPIKDVVDYDFEVGIFGRGTLVLPSDHPRLNDILYRDVDTPANDKGSLIRVFSGNTWLYDFYAKRASTTPGETGNRLTTITGPGPGYALEKTATRQYDYPLLPSVEPDWSYGFGPNLVTNPGFEDTPEGATNLDAEEGTTLGWYTTGNQQTLVGVPERFEAKTGAGAHSGDWYFEIEADAYEGAIRKLPTIEDEDYVISVWVKAAVGVTYRVSVDNVSAATVGTMFNNSAYVDGVGTGAYQDVGVAFTSAASGEDVEPGTSEVRLHITSREASGVVAFDDVTMTGLGTGTDGWKYRGNITTFEAQDTYAHSGTYSLAWKPSSGVAGNDVPYQTVNVVAGRNLTASAWFYHTEAAAKLFRLTIRYPGVNPNTANVASVQKSVPPSTWTEIEASGVSTSATVELELRYDETGVPTNNLFTDDASVYLGRPEQTLGFIFGEQLDDAATNHTSSNRTALDWLVKTFSDTLDSGSTAWDQTLAMKVPRGNTLRRLTETSVDRWLYEARMRPNPADLTEYQFDLFNPGGMGTDYSITNGNAVTNSGMVSFGPTITNEPNATYAMVEGDEQYYGEALDLTMRGIWGDMEVFQSSDEMLVGTLQEVAAGLISRDVANAVSVKFQNPALTPGIDYDIGDTVMLILGEDVLPAAAYRVYSIVVKSGDPEPTFQVQFGQEA